MSFRHNGHGDPGKASDLPAGGPLASALGSISPSSRAGFERSFDPKATAFGEQREVPAAWAEARRTPRIGSILRRALRCVALVLFGVSFTVSFLAAGAPGTDELVDPRELVAELRERRPEAGSEISATLTIRAKGREKQQFAVRLTTRVELESWSTRYEVRSASQKDSGTVRESAQVTHFGSAPPHYAWESAETSQSDTKSGARFEAGSKDSLRPFAGSDFWIADLGLEFLFWPDHRLLGQQTRRTRECYMVESRPARIAEGGYARVVSWIDRKSRQLVRAEAFDGSGRTMKIFKPDEFVYFKGQWRVKQLAIDSPIAGSASYLVFNFRSESIEEKPGGKP